jgi:hypothetical protein
MSIDRLAKLRAADEGEIEKAQKRYQKISDTLDDTVRKLDKIVSAGDDALRGEWVGALKKDATSLKESLQKAGVRYRDVAGEIKKYEPELHTAIVEVNAAERDERDGQATLNRANAMPDPQPGPDGTTSPEEQQKGADKNRAQENANADIAAAKGRLNGALDALGVAGKRLGDAVNCKNYDDGLTDKINWRVMAIFKVLSKVFAILGMILAVFAIFLPGVNVLILAGVAAGVGALISDSVLLAGGDGSVLDVVLGVVGLGLAGLGAWASVFAKGKAFDARRLGNLTGRPPVVSQNPPQLQFADEWIELGTGVGRPPRVYVTTQYGPNDFRIPANAATNWQNTADWFNVPGINWLLGAGGKVLPEFGYFASTWMQLKAAIGMWKGLFTNPGQFFKDWLGVIGGLSGYRDLAGTLAAVGGKVPGWMIPFGAFTGLFTLGISLIYTGGRTSEVFPNVPDNN